MDASSSGYGPVAGSCEHDTEPSSNIKQRGVISLLGE